MKAHLCTLLLPILVSCSYCLPTDTDQLLNSVYQKNYEYEVCVKQSGRNACTPEFKESQKALERALMQGIDVNRVRGAYKLGGLDGQTATVNNPLETTP